MMVLENAMNAQTAIKPNPLLLYRGIYGIVMRGMQKCTRGYLSSQ